VPRGGGVGGALTRPGRAARQGLVVFDIDGEKWTLDLRPGQRKVSSGAPEGKPDLTLTISDDNFVKLVMGKMGPQQARRPPAGPRPCALAGRRPPPRGVARVSWCRYSLSQCGLVWCLRSVQGATASRCRPRALVAACTRAGLPLCPRRIRSAAAEPAGWKAQSMTAA